MTNYVIINGVNSNTINGLGINELPPITKPSMRVLTEEIDGRDGDITTNLGYSAYDKTITIGLFGTGYDIDDIVAFFNGEGTIVFSNEADKYYNYKIVNQIDYVALQKFKSASITFHCQPFKYPLEETPIEIDYDYIEEQDVESATLNTAEATIQVNLLGNTSQTGTPTPSSPIPVNVVSGDNTIVSTGKNLANTKITNWSYLGVSVSYDETTQVLTINGTSTGDAQVSFQNSNFSPISVSNGERINLVVEYISGSAASTGNARITLSDINYTMSALISLNGINTSKIEYKNISTNLTYDKLNFVYRTGDVYNNLKIKIMVCKGTDTTYEPYTSTSYPIHLGEYELCKISTYQDSFFKAVTGNSIYDNLDSATKESLTYGEWYLEKKIGKVVLDGSETGWASIQMSNVYGYYRNINNILSPSSASILGLGLSNYFGIVTPGQNWATSVGSNNFSINNSNYSNTYIRFTKGETTDKLADFKTWLGTNNVSVYYVYYTPTYTQITGTLKDELEAVWRANSYKGTTNINQINNDLPFKMNLKAIEEGSNEGIVNNIGNTYAKPTIELEGTGEINIYLNDVQMLKATLTDKMTIDIAKMEAYNPDTSVLLNRQLIGDISKFLLPSGESTIRIDGNLTKATISNYTRWL